MFNKTNLIAVAIVAAAAFTAAPSANASVTAGMSSAAAAITTSAAPAAHGNIVLAGISASVTKAFKRLPTVCKKHVDTGSGRWKSKSKAAWAARAKWRYIVAKHDGVQWAKWSNAKNVTKKCSKKWYGGWKCRYQATACRYSID